MVVVLSQETSERRWVGGERERVGGVGGVRGVSIKKLSGRRVDITHNSIVCVKVFSTYFLKNLQHLNPFNPPLTISFFSLTFLK